jgi:quercetin dioxygenase-like cupin family protein
MSCVHKFKGVGGSFEWEGASAQDYEPPAAQGVAVRWLIGTQESAPHFAMRYFEVEPGGRTSLDSHEHDHGVMILSGRGRVLLGDDESEVSFGDVVYIPPYELHQFKNIGREPLGFLCVVPARSQAE